MLVNYSVTFGLALFIATKVPYISPTYVYFRCSSPSGRSLHVLLVAETVTQQHLNA